MLALWEYFWDTADWVAAPAPAPPPSQADVARGSGPHGYQEPEYLRAGDDFWEVREAYIRSKVPVEVREEIKTPTEPAYKEVAPVIQLRDKAYQEALEANNIIDLQNLIGQVLELTGRIVSLRAQYDDEAITLLLLS